MKSIAFRLLFSYSFVIIFLLSSIPLVSITYYEWNQNDKHYKGIAKNTQLLHTYIADSNVKDIKNVEEALALKHEFLFIIKNKELVFTNRSAHTTSHILKELKYDEEQFYRINNQNNLEYFYKDNIDKHYNYQSKLFYDIGNFLFQFEVIEKGTDVYQFYLGLNEHLENDSIEDVYGKNIFRDIFLISSLVFLVLYTYAFLTLKILVKPAHDILEDIEGLKAQNNISLRIDNNYKNEDFKNIANNFNQMLDEIENDVEQIKQLTITDGLTNLYNRRHFDDVFQKEFDRAKREKTTLVLSIFDIDKFKLYNDYYGHQQGDVALKQVSNVIHQNTQRANDFAFRVGGEEFAIISINMTEQEAFNYFEKIRKDIENVKIEHKHNPASQYMTISFGVMVVNFDTLDLNDMLNPVHLYKMTDELLYEAKETQRNIVKTDTYKAM